MPKIAFIDESGDHGLTAIDPGSPVFVLTAAVYSMDQYLYHEIPRVSELKIKKWGHEGVILHSHEIRKRLGDFSFCKDRVAEAAFHGEMGDLFKHSRCTLISAAIDKKRLTHQYIDPGHPYFLSVQFVLERIHMMCGSGEAVRVVFESRGDKEDAELAGWCDLICSGENYRQEKFNLDITFAKKKHNVTGLQVADLAAYPISHFVRDQKCQRPDWLAVKSRVRQRFGGGILGYGLKVFP